MLDKFKKALKNALNVRLLINVLISVLYIAIFTAIAANGKTNHLVYTGILLIALYVLTAYMVHIALHFIFERTALIQKETINPILGNITLEFMQKLYMPILICDVSGKIIWYNKSMAAANPQKTPMYGKNIDALCHMPLDQLLVSSDTEPGIEAEMFGISYRVKNYNIVSQNRNYIITVWNDISIEKHLTERLRWEELTVAHIIIDNLDELLQYVQEKHRAAAAQVEDVLNLWAESVNGIIKEYGKNKFIFLFEARYLEQFIADRFDVLDKIREIRIGEESMPVTISIGIANIPGTFSEKNQAAQNSLDTALQRGGDQVVVKNEHNVEFYGGKTKTVQKRTKVRARVVAHELVMRITKADNVLIMGHRNADFDSFGSSVGLARLSMFCGCKVNIIAKTGDPNIAQCIERIHQIPDFKYTIVDAASAQDLVMPNTLLIITDVNNPEQFEAPEIASMIKDYVIIDHHRKATEFTNEPLITYIEPSASSASELVSEILEQAMPAGLLPKEEADLLFAGILLDTKQFARNTGVRTFGAALYLRNEGASPSDAQDMFKTELDELISEAKFESNVIIYRESIAIAAYDENCTPKERVAAAKAADKLLWINGVLASFALCRIDDTIHISARSLGGVNVQLIVEKLNGGGQFNAAATQMRDTTMSEALLKLREAIDEYITETEKTL